MILFVSGFQRCGSSLVMQMLAAGGMPVVHDPEMGFPSYETHLNETGEPLDTYDGRAMKWLEPCRAMPPIVPFEVRALWLTRDHVQQGKSSVKFLRACGVTYVRDSDAKRFAKSYDRDERRSVELWRKRGEVAVIKFEDLLLGGRVIDNISFFCGGKLDTSAMLRQIRKRPPECVDYILEKELMARGALA